MELSIIENRVNYLLENSPIGREGDKETSRKALFHMLMASAIMDTMSDEKKKELIKDKKHFDYFFSTKLNIKKHSRKEKKKASPHTPYKDKAEKEREIEGESFGDGVLNFGDGDLAVRKQALWAELLKRKDIYGLEMLQDFFDYWSEESRTKGVMLFEKRTHWNLDSRLRKWSRNSQTLANAEAAERMRRRQKRQAKEHDDAAVAEQQREVAAQREAANAELERQIEQSKAGAVSYEEWKAMKKNNGLNGLFYEGIAADETKIPSD